MKRFFIVGIIYFLFLINTLSANNIAFIDIKLLMQTSTAGLNISSKIKILEKQTIKLIENVENDLKDKEKELVAKKNILSENDFKIEISKLKKEINEFNVMKNYELKNLEKKKAQYNGKLLDSIKIILADHAKSNEITLLLQKQNIILGSNDINITDDILNILNKKIKEIKLK